MVYQKILEDFEDTLRAAKKKAAGTMQEAVAGNKLCQDCLDRMRGAVAEHGFKNASTEIDFFKNVKSGPLSRLIYYTEVRSFQMNVPKWDGQARSEYIKAEIDRINSFLEANLDFRFYMDSGGNDRDERFFTRKFLNVAPISLSGPYYRDSLFNTSHDGLWARIMGQELYGNFLNDLVSELYRVPNESRSETNATEYRFTMPATAAIELIYALKLAGFINHGDFEIKAFVEFFSETFNLAIKDPYGLFKQIAQRKTDRAKYLNRLTDALLSELETRDGYIP